MIQSSLGYHLVHLCSTAINFQMFQIFNQVIHWHYNINILNSIYVCIVYSAYAFRKLVDVVSQRMLIPNPDLNFWNVDPKIHFWANLGPKIQSCLFYLKIGTHNILRMLIPNPDLDFWNFDPKIHFWANLGRKSQSCPFIWKLVHIVSLECWFWI